MEIPPPGGASASARRSRKRRVPIGALLGVVACFAALAISFAGYVQSYRKPGVHPPISSPEGRQALLDMALAAPRRLLAPLRSEPIERLRLDIKFRDFQKLAAKREEALRRRMLLTASDDFVPATLRHDGRAVRVRVRLKGDLVDHLSGDKWSFRVEVRGGDHVLGMRRFSLQAPYTRSYQAEPIFLDFLREQGILAPRYFFVDLTLNGDPVGRMALEEHFSTELLEHQSRRDGVIVRYDEQYFWRAELTFRDKVPDFDNWRNAPLDAFRSTRVDRSPELRAQRDIAFGLLRGVMEDRLAPSRALDVRLWGRLLAACELWSASHMAFWNNFRFYLNPLTLEIEPIAYDATGRTAPIGGFRCLGDDHAMTSALIRDRGVRAAFLESLRELAAWMSGAEFESWLREREARYLPLLMDEFPWLRPLPVESLRARAHELSMVTRANFRRHLRPLSVRHTPHDRGAKYPTAVYAYLQRDDRGPFVELANALSRSVTVTELGIERDGDGGLEPLPARRTTQLALALRPTAWAEKPKLVRFDFPEPASRTSARSEPAPVAWTVAGRARVGDATYPFEAIETAPALARPALPRPSLEEALARHSFLRWDPAARRLAADVGRFDVEGSLVLPPGVGLQIRAGTTLRFEGDAMLLARGSLEFLGTADAPVVLEGRGGERERASWWGVVALGNDTPSHWSHVVVRNTTGPKLRGWGVTGGVTFHRAELLLEDCVFEGSRAEDALNLIRSRIDLRGVDIRDVDSDAIDADFCEGSIRGGQIADAGGDGIDVSGSRLEIDDVSLSRIRDKAVSVGEGSDVRARRLRVEDCGTGIASKDSSKTHVTDSSFSRIEFAALVAYRKKAHYGPGELVGERLHIRDASREALVQLASRIALDGRDVPPEPLDVEALYARGPMRK